MKKLILLITMALAICSCKKESSTITTNDMVSDTIAMIKYSGNFENGPYGMVTGQANIIKLSNGDLQLQLKDFNTSNGPDLKVYLSKEKMPINFINLGNLKSTNGNQLYDIMGAIDFKEYQYACIHCKAFNHLFGTAQLK